ncbi:MAG TPA: hypothetical protein VH107_10055 [Lacipirellulaceae bacterium]|nr:hypothetical protein [Lacipirellulaceae bacterium]
MRFTGALLIAVGLTLLLVSMLMPNVPAVTAMAIVACGATQSTLARGERSPALPTIMLLHAGVYLSLYATFVCAVLYTPHAALTHVLGWPAAFDLGLSIVPMAAALQLVGASLRTTADSRQ